MSALLLTVAYSLGFAVPLLAFALGGQRAGRLAVVRAHAVGLRRGLGVVIAATALAIALNVDRHFTTVVPGYTKAVQDHIEDSARARRALAGLHEAGTRAGRDGQARAVLDDYGPAPDFADVSLWLNTPGGQPLTMAGLRGKVVLVNFWTYTCINCLRELPHVKAWYDAYRHDGFVVVGVHAPEFAFEHEPRNVRRAVRDLGIELSRAPRQRLRDVERVREPVLARQLSGRPGGPRAVRPLRGGRVRPHGARHSHAAGRRRHTARRAHARIARPRGRRRRRRTSAGSASPPTTSGSPIEEERMARYTFPPRRCAEDGFAYGGRWRVEGERIVAGRNARLRMRAYARLVHLVLSGRGTVDVLVDGRRTRTVRVSANKLYTLARLRQTRTIGRSSCGSARGSPRTPSRSARSRSSPGKPA